MPALLHGGMCARDRARELKNVGALGRKMPSVPSAKALPDFVAPFATPHTCHKCLTFQP